MFKLRRAYSVVFSPCGDRLVSTSSSAVVVRQTSVPQKQWVYKIPHPSRLAFSRDGMSLAVKTTSGRIVVLDPSAEHTPPRVLREDEGEGAAPCFSACGRYLVDGSWDGVLEQRDARTGEVVWRQKFENEQIRAIHASADRRRWVVVHAPKATTHNRPPAPEYLSLWSYPFGARPAAKIFPKHPFVWNSALTADGEYLLMTHGAPPAALTLLQVQSGHVIRSVPIEPGGTGLALAWAPNDSYIGSAQNDCVRFYTPRLEPLSEVALAYPSCVAFSADGRWIALGSWSSGILAEREELLSTAVSTLQGLRGELMNAGF